MLMRCTISVCCVYDTCHWLTFIRFICLCYSNGVGMSAVFAAVANGIESFDTKKATDIYSIVKGLRKDRAGAIQHFEQYKFVYQVILICLTPLAIF